jgi:polyphosphate kinase 2
MGKKKKEKKAPSYKKELARLQAELVKLQLWVKETGARAIVVFEGRDAAGKGGVIKRITERTSPRIFQVVALPAPNERERTQIYYQRYIERFPAAGEIVLFDRSWYNRLLVERVMGFCTTEEYERFKNMVPHFEENIIASGVILIKYWFDISQKTQTERFKGRMTDPRKVWKLSPMDLESHARWYDYSRAIDAMFENTDTDLSPWNVVRADNKKSARLNCIAHLLDQFPYVEIPRRKVKLPPRQSAEDYASPEIRAHTVPEIYQFE